VQELLGLPFFEDRHREAAARLEAWCAANLPVDHGDVDAACAGLVAGLGAAGFLMPTAPDGPGAPLDTRMLCLSRDILARHDGLADFAFALQGLGAGPISLFGAPGQRALLDETRRGQKIPAFALTEPQAGSDAAAMEMLAERDGGDFVLSGEKTFISNGGIADFYITFARTGEAEGARGISAFLVPADAPGLTVAERIETIAPHPLALLRFTRVRLPASALVGTAGSGFRHAMAVLDHFRPTVGAAALGFARRAMALAKAHVRQRAVRGATLASQQMVQGHIADMASLLDGATLLVYRAAYLADRAGKPATREAAMAKLAATEAAQEIIDLAVQLHGGLGVVAGSGPETLYREIRALRIYEGASDILRLVIARHELSD
jgi:acyl-CoA dehydrogenase